jgi:hypothetical protein
MTTPLATTALAFAAASPDAGYLDGNQLLNDLSGENGEHMHSVAMGYVMGMHDARIGSAAAAPAPAAGAPRSLRQEVDRVLRWLRRNPELRGQPAVMLVRTALDGMPKAAPAPARRGAALLAWLATRAGSVAATAALAVAIGFLLGAWGAPDVARSRPFEQSVALSERASEITNLVLEIRRFEKDSFLNVGDRAELAAYVAKWEATRLSMNEAIERAERLDLGERDRQSLRQIDADFGVYVEGYRAVLAMIERGQIGTAQGANEHLAMYKGAIRRVEANGAALSARAIERLGKMT